MTACKNNRKKFINKYLQPNKLGDNLDCFSPDFSLSLLHFIEINFLNEQSFILLVS